MSTYLITGAGKGIGFQIVSNLIEKGHKVYATSRNIINLTKLKEQHELANLFILSVDLSLHDQVKELISSLPVLDGVVNNAGYLEPALFEESTDAQWEKQFEINFFAPVRLLRDLKRQKKLSNASHVVNISSMGGLQGSSKFPGLSAYSASKGALSILTECLATEWAADQIAVNALCLGAVKTEMLAKAFPGYEPPVTAQQMGAYIADFLCNSGGLISGKVLAVAGQDPA